MRYGPNTTQGHGHGSRRLTRLHCTWHSTRYDGVRTGTCSGAACGGKRAAACLRSPPAYGARSTRAAALVDRVDRGAVACGAVLCGAVALGAVELGDAERSAGGHGATRSGAVQHDAVRWWPAERGAANESGKRAGSPRQRERQPNGEHACWEDFRDQSHLQALLCNGAASPQVDPVASGPPAHRSGGSLP